MQQTYAKVFRVLCGKFADFYRKEDYGYFIRSCLDFEAVPFFGRSPYRAGCGVFYRFFLSGSAKPSTKEIEKAPHFCFSPTRPLEPGPH